MRHLDEMGKFKDNQIIQILLLGRCMVIMQKSSPVEETRVLVWNDKVSEGIGEMKKCYKVMTS